MGFEVKTWAEPTVTSRAHPCLLPETSGPWGGLGGGEAAQGHASLPGALSWSSRGPTGTEALSFPRPLHREAALPVCGGAAQGF